MLFTKKARSLPHAVHYQRLQQYQYVEKRENSIAFLGLLLKVW